MKRTLLLTAVLIFACDSALAMQQIPDSILNMSVSNPISWEASSITPDGYSCSNAKASKTLTFLVQTYKKLNPTSGGIYLICNGINGFTKQHVLVGQSANLCTIACHTKQYIQWESDSNIEAYGKMSYLYSK